MKNFLFTSESITEGHPDKLSDRIADAVLDAVLKEDKQGRVACEVATGRGYVLVGGEITTRVWVDVNNLVREVIKDIGYDRPEYGFDYRTVAIFNTINEQSPEIAQGVRETGSKEQGAGDQGLMVGFASTETPELMPLPIQLAHTLSRRLTEVRKKKILPWLRPDGKTQVTVEYRDSKPFRLHSVVIAAQYDPGIELAPLRQAIIKEVIQPSCKEYVAESTKFYVNNTGRFVIGGPVADCGQTGRKIIADTYGGMAAHGGGAFCIAGDSFINTEKGLLRIDESQTVGENGLLVKTDVHPAPAGAWYDNGVKPTEILVTQDGYQLEATPNHNIRIIDGHGSYVWRPVGKIKEGDWISIQTKHRLFGNDEIPEFTFQYKPGTAEGRKKKYVFPKKLTEDYAYLLGLLVGDGYCNDRGCIRICICEQEMRAIVQKMFERVVGDKGRIYGHWAYLGGVELRGFLEHLGLTYAKSFEKTVPKSIFTASKKGCAAFLKGLFDTDGSIRIDGRNKNTKRIHLTTTSHKLAQQVQLLLLNFGILSTVRATDVRGNSSWIQGRKVTSAHVRYDVTLKGSQSIRLFEEHIGFTLYRKQKILNSHVPVKRDLRVAPNQKRKIIQLFKKLPLEEQRKDACKIGRFTRSSKGKATKELTYEKLKEFIATYTTFLNGNTEFIQLQELLHMGHHYSRLKRRIPSFAHTYDLNIPFSHTFTANGIICHNSGKDPTKVDRSGAYMARYVAKNIVAAGLAKKCEVQIAYVIGGTSPLSLNVNFFGTGKVSEERVADVIPSVFKLSPGELIQELDLLRPIYRKTSCYGHFGREEPEFTWEKTDRVESLLKHL